MNDGFSPLCIVMGLLSPSLLLTWPKKYARLLEEEEEEEEGRKKRNIATGLGIDNLGRDSQTKTLLARKFGESSSFSVLTTRRSMIILKGSDSNRASSSSSSSSSSFSSSSSRHTTNHRLH